MSTQLALLSALAISEAKKKYGPYHNGTESLEEMLHRFLREAMVDVEEERERFKNMLEFSCDPEKERAVKFLESALADMNPCFSEALKKASDEYHKRSRALLHEMHLARLARVFGSCLVPEGISKKMAEAVALQI
ncbi:MAG TPA: hypothetical protein VD928_03360 [Candidatus Paceibacterota bacterium]|nr:hypothetical protein [Candidatus Paceibacterota bacterium]